MAEVRVIDSEPIGEDVIARLKETLEEAEAGKISSVAIAIVYRDGFTDNLWSTAPSLSTLIGAVSRLEYRLNQRAAGDD